MPLETLDQSLGELQEMDELVLRDKEPLGMIGTRGKQHRNFDYVSRERNVEPHPLGGDGIGVDRALVGRKRMLDDYYHARGDPGRHGHLAVVPPLLDT